MLEQLSEKLQSLSTTLECITESDACQIFGAVSEVLETKLNCYIIDILKMQAGIGGSIMVPSVSSTRDSSRGSIENLQVTAFSGSVWSWVYRQRKPLWLGNILPLDTSKDATNKWDNGVVEKGYLYFSPETNEILVVPLICKEAFVGLFSIEFPRDTSLNRGLVEEIIGLSRCLATILWKVWVRKQFIADANDAITRFRRDMWDETTKPILDEYRTGFIARPFLPEFEPIEKYIRECFKGMGVRINAYDHRPGSGIVIEDIRAQIESAHFGIVDITAYNSNVLLELGMLYMLRKKFILLINQEDTSEPPYDLTPFHLYPYVMRQDALMVAQPAVGQLRPISEVFQAFMQELLMIPSFRSTKPYHLNDVASTAPRESKQIMQELLMIPSFQSTKPYHLNDVASTAPRESKQISAWISELNQLLDEPLLVGYSYTLNFKVGSPIALSLITGADAYVSPADVPEQGLDTKWAVMSRDVELAALSPEVTIKTRTLGNAQAWIAQFDLHIPKDEESAVRQLRITPRHARMATLDINIFSRGELFRQFLVELSVTSVGADDKSNGTPTVAVKDDTVITLPGELGLKPQHEWQTPPGKLQIIVAGDDGAYVQGSIFTNNEWLDIGDSTEWHTSQTEINGPITNVRRAAEHFREDFEPYLNGIEPTDLAARLANFQPVYTWDEAHDRADRQADRAHTEAWEQVRQSERLRDLAAEGYILYQRLFPAGSDLRKWLDGLTPGHLLDIRWTQKDRAGVSSIPWSLVYMADPDDPIDPLRFMGLRFRLSYWAHAMPPTSQALGDPATTYRAHLLYWGSGETDAASVEARWQRDLWAGLVPQVVTGPVSTAPKSALLQVIRVPAPVPMTVLYLFCHCDVGEGNEVVLRFGGTKNREDIIRQTELPNKPLNKAPYGRTLRTSALSSGTGSLRA